MSTENTGFNHQTLKEYNIRINRVLDYIENNLGSELTLDTLSKLACFSTFHFHRIFHSMTGETPLNYIKKRRLLAAAGRLYYRSDIKLADIAYEFGFSSQSDFSRSFKAFFKVSPSEFYKVRREKYPVVYSDEIIKKSLIPKNKKMYEQGVTLKFLEDYKVVYIRNTGLTEKHKNDEIEKSFKKLYTWASARDLINSSTLVMGITLDNPEILPLKECRHDTCLTINRMVEPDGSIGIRELYSRGKYASYVFDTSTADFSNVFFEVIDYLYGCWMPENGYLPEDRPCIELYRQNHLNSNIFIDLLIPIRPL